MTPEQLKIAKEQVDNLKQESPEIAQMRAAQRNIKYAFWDFESEGGTSVREFLKSDYFKKAIETHTATYNSENGINEAVNFLIAKYEPIEPNPNNKKPSSPHENRDTMRLETDKEADARIKALHTEYSVISNTTAPLTQDISVQLAANDPVFEIPKNKNREKIDRSSTLEDVGNLPPVSEAQAPSPLQTQEAAVLSPAEPAKLNTKEKQQVPASTQESSQPETSPAPEKIQPLEQKLERGEVVQRLVIGYRSFLYGIHQYNEHTLDRNGRETSESLFYNSDIENIINELDAVSSIDSEESINKASLVITRVTDFITKNSFPIQGGMQVSNIEGYNLILDIAKDFTKELQKFYTNLSEDQKNEFGDTIENFYNFINNLGGVMEKKKHHLENYLSR